MTTNNNFFAEAFEGYQVPNNIKNVSIEICETFNIKGLSDPMYISNVIAYETGTGDGSHNFYSNEIDTSKIEGLYDRFAYAYATCIRNSNGTENDLRTILNKL